MRRLISSSINICWGFVAAIIIGGLVLSSICLGYSGGAGTAENPYRIATKADLLALAGTTADYNKCFIMTADINMEGQVFTTAIIAADTSSSSGFQGTAFTGAFDGNSHKITNFAINGGSGDFLGLFGLIDYGGSVENLGLEAFAVSGTYHVGGLVGLSYAGISNCYSTGAVSGTSNSYMVGGLVGLNYVTISQCYSTGTVSGSEEVGGLVGENDSGSISNCYSTGNIISFEYVGGLVGLNYASVSNCYSTGAVSGTYHVGGLVGYKVMGSIGGCYFLIASGPNNGYGTPLTDAQMKQRSSFVGWDFTNETANGTNNYWRMCVDGLYYPHFRWEYSSHGDFVCPDGVDFYDFAVFANQWLLKEIPADVWPEGGDGIVDFHDWAVFANQWQITVDIENLADFAEQWLKTGNNYCIADIAPALGGDGVVDMLDLEIFAHNWLEGL